MRYLISFLLLFAILENVISDDSIKKRMLRVALKLKEIQKRKEMQRKLQDGVEVIDGKSDQPEPPVPTIVEPTIPENIPYNDTGNNNSESSDPFGADSIVPSNKPYTPPKKTDKKTTANIQPVKFHGFKANQQSNNLWKINFGTYIYIFGIPIPYNIIYRLRIIYGSRLRNLEVVENESVKSECTLSEQSKSLAGKNATDGESPNYDCEANTKNDPTKAQVAINTDVDMAYSKPDGSFEYLSFNEINFNGNSSEEATNLQQSTEEVPEFDILEGGDILEDGDTHTLRIKGTQKRGAFIVKENVTMNFENLYKDGEDNVEPYECTINSTTPFILNCDTSKHSIRTSPKSLHLSSGVKNVSVTQSRRAEVTVKQKLLMIEMANPNNTNTYDYYTTGSNAKYRKKSSGLSGGAIAGIVIACVVVLVAASIAAIMLRKPSPPIDNSTVVGLKSADNI